MQTLWVGGNGGMEAGLVERAGIPFKSIPASGVHGVGLRALPGNLAQLARGVAASRRILGEFKPDVLFFTGGYVAVPMAAAAGRRIPSVLYVPDIEPGLALKTLGRLARRIAVTARESNAFFARPERITVTGYPVRADLAGWDRASARQALQLSADLPVVLVTGGSKGARTLNNPVLEHLPELLELAQVVHITGELDWDDIRSRTAGLERHERYHAYPYLHEQMGAALAAADLAIARAGASTLGEFPLFGLPAILVPYPYAWRYQKVNADYLTSRGAALMIANEDLSTRLLPAVQALLQDPGRLAAMRSAMQSLSHPQAAEAIGALLTGLAEKRS